MVVLRLKPGFKLPFLKRFIHLCDDLLFAQKTVAHRFIKLRDMGIVTAFYGGFGKHRPVIHGADRKGKVVYNIAPYTEGDGPDGAAKQGGLFSNLLKLV